MSMEQDYMTPWELVLYEIEAVFSGRTAKEPGAVVSRIRIRVLQYGT